MESRGTFALWSGYTAAVIRGFIFHGLKIPFYDLFKGAICSPEEMINTPTYKKMSCGLLAGAVATVAATPIEGVKIKI